MDAGFLLDPPRGVFALATTLLRAGVNRSVLIPIFELLFSKPRPARTSVRTGKDVCLRPRAGECGTLQKNVVELLVSKAVDEALRLQTLLLGWRPTRGCSQLHNDTETRLRNMCAIPGVVFRGLSRGKLTSWDNSSDQVYSTSET